MDILYQSTKRFEKDLSSLGAEEKNRAVKAINRLGEETLLNEGSHKLKLVKPLSVELAEDLDSTLYVYRATPRIRIVLTVDNDPLFDEVVVTLLRAVTCDKMHQAFRSMAESIYQKKLLKIEEVD